MGGSLLGFDREGKTYKDTGNIPKFLQGTDDGEIVSEDQCRVVTNTCNGRGARSDLSSIQGRGHLEVVALTDDTVLGLSKFTPNKELSRQISGEAFLAIGVRFQHIEERVPLINSTENHIFYCGALSNRATAKNLFSPQTSYSQLSILAPLKAATKLLGVRVPAMNRLIKNSLEELKESDSFFSFQAV